ncbi:hypothetical protein FHS39_002213 [Streptomyces olivoverticillatus]|uniref:Uncharacterized protein n=1 Tax=Streptomyces olivoverticillatus TaxID=66427 RepID=A0A7W7LNP4_9ACTN|nr:hypothetical protein [Streptomyces olivoverticillatus]MBB4893182.1 hypothetical protein [Streptomyces olivoverticillatus]
MIDPVSLSAITAAVSAAAGSVGTEAGRQAWGSLTDLARRTFRRADDGEDTALLPLDPQDDEQVQALSALIFGRVYQDPQFADEYRQWAERAAAVSVDNSRVTNTISGRARVRNAYQGRDITVRPE